MRKKNIIIIVIISLVLIFHTQIYIGLWFGAAYIEGWITDYKVTKIEREARDKNIEAAENWVKAAYGEEVAKVVEVKYTGRGRGWSVYSHFTMDAPFAVGWIVVNSEDQSIVSGGFDLEDSKFQHLYSEWVKKQIGVDDENVELKIGFSTSGLDFRKINKLSNDYSEIFRAIEKFEVMDVYIKNQTSVNENNVNDIARDYYKKFFSLNKNISGKTYYIYIIRYDCDINDFMNSRKGDYYTCCFEEGMLKYAKNRYI